MATYTRSKDYGVQGMADLTKTLEKFSIEVRTDALRSAGRKAGNVVKESAIEKAPYDTGQLSESISVNTSFREGNLEVKVGPSKEGFYGRFWEMGTKKLAAKPFLAPALEQNVDKVLGAFTEAIRKAVRKAERRANQSKGRK